MKSENLMELKQKMGMLPNGYMGNLAAVFLKKLMKNYDEVKVIIKDFLEQNLNKTVGTYDTRTYHHGVFIKLTEALFRKYMCGGLSNWSETAVLNVAIEKNCRIQQKDLQRECDIDYTLDVYDMLTSNDKYLIAKTDRFQYDQDLIRTIISKIVQHMSPERLWSMVWENIMIKSCPGKKLLMIWMKKQF